MVEKDVSIVEKVRLLILLYLDSYDYLRETYEEQKILVMGELGRPLVYW